MTAALPPPSAKETHLDILSAIPSDWEVWPFETGSANQKCRSHSDLTHALHKHNPKSKLKFPDRPVIFISDAHADAEAFEASLIASGAFVRDEPGLCNLSLTKRGRKSEIMIGGDCLDKGPSNLSLLRSVQHLYRIGARVTLLAGNHDLRLLMGLMTLKRDGDVGNQHFFVRMGKKVVPLFREVFIQYLENSNWCKSVPSESDCRKILFPNDDWFDIFPYHAAGILTPEGIERETRKMHAKVTTFQQHCRDAGLSLRQVYAAAIKCQQLFLNKKGEFHWFFREMKLVEKRGSFLFLHAGLDDSMCDLLLKKNTKYANKAFHNNLKRRDLFSFYYSPIANTFRTKYRKADLPLTERGVRAIHKAGIKIVVQGHINRDSGQRITIKNGLVHLEADVTLDANSRKLEGLAGPGIGATLISKKMGIVGISSDHPKIKVLQPKYLSTKLRSKK